MGQANKTLFYVIAGNVNITAWHLMKKEEILELNDDKMHSTNKKIRELHLGQYFGEISYLYDTTTTAAAHAGNYTTLGLLEQAKADELFSSFPDYRELIESNTIENYIDDQMLFLVSVMRRIEYLEDEEIASTEMLTKLAHCFKQETFEKGQQLFEVNTKATKMYIIAEGFIEIATIMDGSEMQIDYLTYASSMNAWMMLFQSNLNVSAHCKSKVVCYTLPQHLFFKIVSKYNDFNCYLMQKLAVIQEGAENLITLDYVSGKTFLQFNT